MRISLDQLETRLQSLVEEQLAGILPGLHLQGRVVQRLSAALQQNIIKNSDEDVIAPNVYTLIVSPDSSSFWKEESVLNALTGIVIAAGDDIGIKFTGKPTIAIAIDEHCSNEDISILASHKLEPIEDTKGMSDHANAPTVEITDSAPENAFLIIEGIKVYSLDKPVINIGRRLENQLVIDDPRISRAHAQIRSIRGQFILFDLNSTGGTFVNGQRTVQTVLYPGDVISLAGVSLIFGQDTSAGRSATEETSPLEQQRLQASERPTASIGNRQVEIRTDQFKKNKKDQ
ncbi:MAG: DUF3662 domain-containing protein [Anaerolineales bacterium]|nr:DUF3662 domain-containing protein [Anaerolineales bacterium]